MERAELRALVLATGCATEVGDFVFLRDRHGGAAEQAQFETLCREQGESLPGGAGWLCLPTGGTSGVLRFARHDETTLGAAARGFAAHFSVKKINSVDVLPAHHVSGLMSRVRCAETGGEHRAWSWKKLEAGEWPELPTKNDGWFLSLVPTQLQRLLATAQGAQRLREYRAVFLGGGPLWPNLAERAAAERVPVVICYGMTETAAMVVAQQPEDFLAGDRSCGRTMPHARIETIGEAGLVRIVGESIFRGYWPGVATERVLATEDLGQIDDAGRLTIFGRRDALIITGGKKVHPAEVEAALLASGEFADVAVVGVPDAEWGSAVVACHPATRHVLDLGRIERALAELAPYKRPKRFVAVADWPRNEQGKLNRALLQRAAEEGEADQRPKV